MDNSTSEAKMLEWIPVVLGTVLAMLHMRRVISRRMVPFLACACALASMAINGELIDAPWLLLVDAALVVAGFALSHAVHAQLLRRQTRATS